MKSKVFKTTIGGKELSAEFSDLVDQANGSVIVRLGDTAILATAVMSKHANEGAGWFPLTVDYEERFYAAGAILGSRFMRREGRPSKKRHSLDVLLTELFDHYLINGFEMKYRLSSQFFLLEKTTQIHSASSEQVLHLQHLTFLGTDQLVLYVLEKIVETNL